MVCCVGGAPTWVETNSYHITHSLTHSLTHSPYYSKFGLARTTRSLSLTHSLTLIHLLTHTLSPSLTPNYVSIESLTHSYSLTHSPKNSVSLDTQSLTNSLTHYLPISYEFTHSLPPTTTTTTTTTPTPTTIRYDDDCYNYTSYHIMS
jgi:hypothetical protein